MSAKADRSPRIPQLGLAKNRANAAFDAPPAAQLGGESALSANVETSIAALGLNVARIAGANRFETAAKAAQLIAGRHGDMFPIDALTGERLTGPRPQEAAT